MVINTCDQIVRSAGVEVQAAEKVAVFTQGFELDAKRYQSILLQDLEVSSGKSLLMQVPDEIMVLGTPRRS